jgi:hypothetical protein
MEQKKTLPLEELLRLYQESETADNGQFASYRSNVLLVSGEHFQRRNSEFFSRIRDSKQLSSELKLRISINYINRITKQIINGIMTYAPGVKCYPKNTNELQDQKAAELNEAVRMDLEHRHRLKARRWEHCEDWVNIGETFCEIIWDQNAGVLIPGKPITDGMGQPIINPMSGQPVLSESRFSGDLIFKRHYAFNILRAPEAKTLDESRYLTVREMVNIKDLKRMVEGDPNLTPEQREEKVSRISKSSKTTFMVFEGQSGQYRHSTAEEVLLRKQYFRPCAEFPNGFWVYYTDQDKLWEGELPKTASGKSVFPIVYEGFDNAPTSARANSIIKQLRSQQVELNRCISSIATGHLLGQDKVLYQAGTKVTVGSNLPGFRGYQYTGLEPKIISGNQEERYLNYIAYIVKSMYESANLDQEEKDKPQQGTDAWAMLYQSMRNKKRFSMYAEKFEGFLVRMTETALELAKIYYTEDNLIPAIGRSEQINIPEFKATTDLSFSIKVVEQTDDAETVMGKSLMGQSILQYVGKQLNKEDIGRILRSMPYLNNEEAFGGLALTYDSIKNDILALDRGQYREARPSDEHVEFIKAFENRRRKADFQFLDPQIQQMYDKRIKAHEQFQAEQEEKVQRAKAGYIPATGLMCGVDLYVPGSEPGGKLRRARLPYDALLWLIKQLEAQGQSLEKLESMNRQNLADMAGMMGQQPGMQGPQQPQMPQGSGAQNITNEQIAQMSKNTYGGVN